MDKIVIAHDPESETKLGEPPTARRRYPCSQAQQRFWFEEQLHPGNPGLNVAVRWKLEGAVSTADLETAWRAIIERQQSLRTHFETDDGEPVQIVEPHVAFSIPIVDLTLLPPAEAEREADRIAELEARTPFDLSVAPLIRVTRLVLREKVSTLLVTAHHAVCDGWSIGVLAREMGEICHALYANESPDLPELPISYGEHAEAERAWLKDAPLDTESDFSKRLLAGYKQFELLPDYPRPAIQTSNGAIASRLLDKELTSQLAFLARSNGCTLFMAAYAAFLALLKRYSGEPDIAIGTQVVGRDEVELENLVGCFINTIALRTDVSGDPSFLELLERARDTVTDTFETRHFPLERLIEVVNPKRDLSRNALFSVNMIFQRSFIENADYGAFKLVDLPSRSAGALYDLNFFMVERPEGWRVSCEYNSDLFRSKTVESILDRFVRLLQAVVADSELKVSAIPILSEAELLELTVARNQTAAEFPRDRTIVQLFEAQVASSPDKIALTCGNARLTYAELDTAANELARELQRRRLAPATRVGVFLERSPELVVALLAILKAGSAYVPLDPAYPEARLAFIAKNARLSALISKSTLAGRLDSPSVPVVLTDRLERSGGASSDSLHGAASPDDIAYVVYTSGSTGEPKGVEIQHRALVNLLWAMRERPGLGPSDTLVAVTTVSFDIAALELFLPLITGARLTIARERDAADGAALLALLREAGATVMQATPVTWQLLIEAGWNGNPRLKMLCGGEALPRTLASQLLERGGELWNMYGPTETTIWSAVSRVGDGTDGVPIGPPIANTQFYVLDAFRELVPLGVPGELFIGGDGVAIGYADLPELTAERFVSDPFRGDGGRLYRTGDLVRAIPDGNFEFLGRTDTQVKLRGFRIELGEIEAALARQPEIAEAVAVLVTSPLGDKALSAYVVLRSPQSSAAWTDDLRTRLRGLLPSYMVPTHIVVLDALPRTPNGKLDRAALPAPNVEYAGGALDAGPKTSTEASIAAAIAELLGRESVPRDADIFALGFHSLLAVRLVARLSQSLGTKISLRALFDNPTVSGLAAMVDGERESTRGEPAAPRPIVTLNTGGSRTPFIFLHSDVFADGLYARRIAAAVGASQPFHAVAPHGTAGLPLEPTIEAMALDYLPRIKAIQPKGPYILGGFCVSGLVAYELARLLRSQGDDVEDVILINASALPRREIRFFDSAVRRIGLDRRLGPRLRESLCYNLARLHGAVATGPFAILGFVRQRLQSLLMRNPSRVVAHIDDPQPFEKRRGARETETLYAHMVASLTYHPKAYAGSVTLVWSVDQDETSKDPTVGWNAHVDHVRVVPIIGGHVSLLHDHVGELADTLQGLLGPRNA